MQIDPMAEKYYGMTPYHYCAGNPVMLVDPDGTEATDYYSYNGIFLKHIEDGKDECKMIIKPNISLDEAIETNALFPIPSDEVLSNMDSAYNMTEENGKEHGFQVDVNGAVGDMGEGDEGSVQIPSVYSRTNNYVGYDVHTHPQQESGENSQYLNATPSEADIAGYVGNQPNVVLGYEGYNGTQTRTIGFYNRQGSISSRPFSSFKRVVQRMHKKMQERTSNN